MVPSRFFGTSFHTLRLFFRGELLTEATMSGLARRRRAKPAPKDSDLRIFLKAFGVRRDVVERAVRRSLALQRPVVTSARAFEHRPTWRSP